MRQLKKSTSFIRPWESVWNGVAQWFGIIDPSDLDYVLPNRRNFGCRLLTDADLYKGGIQTNFGCGGDTLEFNQVLLLGAPRYLTGDEQRGVCELMTSVALDAEPDATFNCVILDQRIEEIDSYDTTCTHKLHIKTELSSSATGIGTTVTTEMNNRMSEIVDTLTNNEIVESICGMEKTKVLTPVPSSVPTQSDLPSGVPSQVPSAPTTPTWKKIFVAKFDNGWGPFRSKKLAAIVEGVGYRKSTKSLRIKRRGPSAEAYTGYKTIGDYSKVRLIFFFQTRKVNKGEKFFLEYNFGQGWKVMRQFKLGNGTFTKNNKWYKSGATLATQGKNRIKVRFRSNFSRRGQVFIDNVVFSGLS